MEYFPYDHLVIDEFFPLEKAQKLSQEFPDYDNPSWYCYNNPLEKKKSIKFILNQTSYTWLVTGVAGFIGSNILEELLRLDQKVVGIDNFSTGKIKNLESVKKEVGIKKWKKYTSYFYNIKELFEVMCEDKK